ncbi:hypothetical protein [Paenibacillus sp. NPDC055715]
MNNMRMRNKLLPASSVSGLTIISVFSTEHIVQGANQISLIGALCVLAVLVIGQRRVISPLIRIKVCSFTTGYKISLTTPSLRMLNGGLRQAK